MTTSWLALLPLVAAAQWVPEAAHAGTVHTALTEFDACQPLADGRVAAGSGGGVVIVNSEGREERRITALDGLPGTKVHALEVAPAGLWVGTDKGLARIDITGGAARVVASTKTKPVRDILVEKNSVLLATWGQGVLRVVDGRVEAVHTGGSPRENRITGLARHDGELWWTTAGAGLWHAKDGHAGVRSARIPGNAVLWDLQSYDGGLWVGGEDGAMRLGAAHRASRAVRALAVVNGQLQAASFGQGLQAVGEAKADDAPSDRFARSIGSLKHSACLGTQKALWIRGKTSWKQARFNASLPANDIAAFVTDGKRSYVGTFDHGVAQLRAGRVTPLDVEGDPHVNALAIDKEDGALWIGTSTGLTRYEAGRVTRYSKASGLPSSHVMSLHALQSGGVLVGTAAGPARVQDGMVSAVGGKGRLVTGNVWAVVEGTDGTEWLGTTRGVFRVRGARVDRYRVASGELQDDWVMALATADDGVFVGTYKAGVVRLITTGDTVVAKPLGEGWVNPSGLHWDGEVLRAATMHGAYRGDGIHPEWSSKVQGPGRDTTAYLPASGGSEWLVTRRGLEQRSYAAESK